MADTISVRFDKDLQVDLSKIEKKWKADRSEVIRRLLAEAIKKWKIDNFLEEVRLHKKSVVVYLSHSLTYRTDFLIARLVKLKIIFSIWQTL